MINVEGKKTKKTKVVKIEYVREESGRDWLQINYEQIFNGTPEVLNYKDFVEVPYLENPRWVTGEEYIKQARKITINMVNHMANRYNAFFSAFFREDQLQEVFTQSVKDFMPYIFGDFEAGEDWTKTVREDIRKAIIATLQSLCEALPEGTSGEFFTDFSYTKPKEKIYFQPTSPNKLVLVTRIRKVEDKWESVQKGDPNPHSIYFKWDGKTAQYPFQTKPIDSDVIGMMYATLTKTDGDKKNLWKGESDSYTANMLSKLQIHRSRDAFAKPVEPVIEAEVEQTDEW